MNMERGNVDISELLDLSDGELENYYPEEPRTKKRFSRLKIKPQSRKFSKIKPYKQTLNHIPEHEQIIKANARYKFFLSNGAVLEADNASGELDANEKAIQFKNPVLIQNSEYDPIHISLNDVFLYSTDLSLPRISLRQLMYKMDGPAIPIHNGGKKKRKKTKKRAVARHNFLK